MLLSIILPCYNEEQVIEATISTLEKLQQNYLKDKIISKYEIICVDDGSTDLTRDLINERCGKNKNIKYIGFSRNFGHQAALLAGYQNCQGDLIVTLDSDLQDPPELILEMINKIKEGNEIVFAARNERQKDTLFKKNTAQVFYWLMKTVGVNLVSNHAEYRMITKKVKQAFLVFSERNLFIRAVFSNLGFKNYTLYYQRPKRFAGETKYNFKKMFEFAIDGITSFSVAPLRICTVIGMTLAFFSFVTLIWALTVKLIGSTVPGWTSTVIPFYLLGGIQLFFLGVVGEYIGKIYLEVKQRPRYLIQETINYQQKDNIEK